MWFENLQSVGCIADGLSAEYMIGGIPAEFDLYTDLVADRYSAEFDLYTDQVADTYFAEADLDTDQVADTYFAVYIVVELGFCFGFDKTPFCLNCKTATQ